MASWVASVGAFRVTGVPLLMPMPVPQQEIVSELASAQVSVAHAVSSVVDGLAQEAVAHAWLAAHFVPQPPQLLRSLNRSLQTPPQQWAKPAWQALAGTTHAPAVHETPPAATCGSSVQSWPQPPQLWRSLVGSMQELPHCCWPLAQPLVQV